MAKVVAVVAVLCAVVAVVTCAASDPIKAINTKLTTLQQTLNNINQKLTSHESTINSNKHTLDSISKSLQNHKTSLDSLQKNYNTLNAKTRQQDILLHSHERNVSAIRNQLTTQRNTISHDEAVLKNLTRDSRAQKTKVDVLQRSVNTHNSKLNQHDAKLKQGEQKLGQLTDDLKAEVTKAGNIEKGLTTVTTIVNDNTQKLNTEAQSLESVGRQLMQQQTFVEERIRSEGMSGIKSLRHNREGTRTYYGEHYIGGSALSSHDHADYDRTIGLGEFVAVMNGVDFRTRHNDYKFRMKSRTRKFDEVVEIPFPAVPPQVSSKGTLDEQIKEMREWFKAFRDQDHSVRDYRKYFKPNLCYLEGGWTLNAKTLSEPFQSDRHHIDAKSWFDLQEKIRYSSYGGSKSNLENFAYLPTTMYNFTDGIPQLAQWNYRILCHPLKKDVPTSYFALQDDLAPRLARRYSWDRMRNMRSARFRLNEFGTERGITDSFLDELMYEIPGKDNYGVNRTDNAFGLLHMDVAHKSENVPLNAANYHRWYKLGQKGAMGLQINHRGFRDENLWVAKTTQPNIMPLSIKRCVQRNCHFETTRVTYALPLEIVYTTPLQNWNPLNLEFHEESKVSKNGRNGEQTAAKAFNGTSFRHYYRTPVEFYSDGKTERDAADTARTAVGVLDRHSQMKKAAPTGFRIMTPKIQDVGSVRLRYPIFPAHSQGSPLGEELEALKEMVMRMSHYTNLFEETPVGVQTSQAVDQDVDFHVLESAKNPPGLHGHDFTLTAAEYKSLMAGNDVTVTTSYNLGHNHELVIWYNKGDHLYHYKKCDGQPRCWDAHPNRINKSS